MPKALSVREKLEKKAKELDLPFDETTTDAELEALVVSNESGGEEETANGKKEISLEASGNVVGGPVKGYVRVFSEAQHGKTWKADAEAWRKRFC